MVNDWQHWDLTIGNTKIDGLNSLFVFLALTHTRFVSVFFTELRGLYSAYQRMDGASF